MLTSQKQSRIMCRMEFRLICGTTKCFLEQFCISFSILIQDMAINIRHHVYLCMPRVSLYRFDVAAVQLQLIGDAGMAQAVEDNLWQLVFLN